jgi:tripartite-type tricarboxylate transporter receptor subunit TctC
VQDEAAGKSLNHEVWYALFAPTGTPPEALKRLRDAAAGVLAQPDLSERLRQLGYEVSPSSPEAMTERIRSDLAKWKLVVERAKVVLE